MFVIMLDHHFDIFQHDWPVAARAETLQQARQMPDYDGSPDLVVKNGTAPVIVENKALMNRRTGRTEAGAIYEVR